MPSRGNSLWKNSARLFPYGFATGLCSAAKASVLTVTPPMARNAMLRHTATPRVQTGPVAANPHDRLSEAGVAGSIPAAPTKYFNGLRADCRGGENA